MNLAAVLVHYGDSVFTDATLSKLEYSQAINCIVVVLHDRFEEKQKHTETIFLESENRGYAAGINRAVQYLLNEHTEITHVLAMNADIDITDKEIQAMIAEHQASKADCTFPSLREGSRIIHGYRFNSLGLLRLSENGAAFYPGTIFLLSIEAWVKADGLNEAYFHYFEDVDFCARMQNAGLRIHHASKVIVNHKGKSGQDYPATELPRFAVRNHLRFLAEAGKLNFLSYLSVTSAHFLYLFRWRQGWRGIKQWMKGIHEFRSR